MDERKIARDLGRRVTELRRRKSWTQANLAERLGIDDRQLRRIEAGDVNMTLRSLVRLGRALSVSMSELFAPPASRVRRRPGRPPHA